MNYFSERNGRIILAQSLRLGCGGQGTIYAVPQDSSLVAKVYHHPSPDNRRKVEIMIANPCARIGNSGNPGAWPTEPLFKDPSRRCFIGFLMHRVRGAQPVHELYTPKTRKEKCPNFDYRYLLRTAINMASTVHLAHDRDYVIGDINESNLLVHDNAVVTWVDIDSWQVRDPKTHTVFRCPVGKPDFTPPELLKKNFAGIDRTPEHDLFGFAVLLFKLLMEGTHCFDGIWQGVGDPPSVQARIMAGHFPYGRRRGSLAPKALAPPAQMLHPRLNELFSQCFEDGHLNPRARPDARAWRDVLKEAEGKLIVCRKNPRHWHGQHLGLFCPWCERAARMGGVDPFPVNPVPVKLNRSIPSKRKVYGVPRRTITTTMYAPSAFVKKWSPVHQMVRRMWHIIWPVLVGIILVVMACSFRSSFISRNGRQNSEIPSTNPRTFEVARTEIASAPGVKHPTRYAIVSGGIRSDAKVWKTCQQCNGDGLCRKCDGRRTMICETCIGSASVLTVCRRCAGIGYLERSHEPLADVPFVNLLRLKQGHVRYGCPDCGGNGQMVPTLLGGTQNRTYIQGTGQKFVECETCSGRGRMPCPSCSGTGHCPLCSGRGRMER